MSTATEVPLIYKSEDALNTKNCNVYQLYETSRNANYVGYLEYNTF